MNKYILISLLVIFVLGAGVFLFKSSSYSNPAPTGPQTGFGSITSPSSSSDPVKFSTTADARSAVKIFPGQISDQAKQVMTGYAMQTKDLGNGTTQVTLTPNGNANQALTYQVKPDQMLYFVETRMGDDQTANTDTNLEDDHAVVVDSQGFVVSQ